MDWLKIIIGGLVSTTSVIAATAFILRESFTRLLDKKLETFKPEFTDKKSESSYQSIKSTVLAIKRFHTTSDSLLR
jgi:hypothetical protein